MASEKWLLAAESETNAEEKKGVSVGDCAPYEAVIWGSLYKPSLPRQDGLSNSLTHRGRDTESAETEPFRAA